jgi:hypothetical protein
MLCWILYIWAKTRALTAPIASPMGPPWQTTFHVMLRTEGAFNAPRLHPLRSPLPYISEIHFPFMRVLHTNYKLLFLLLIKRCCFSTKSLKDFFSLFNIMSFRFLFEVFLNLNEFHWFFSAFEHFQRIDFDAQLFTKRLSPNIFEIMKARVSL